MPGPLSSCRICIIFLCCGNTAAVSYITPFALFTSPQEIKAFSKHFSTSFFFAFFAPLRCERAADGSHLLPLLCLTFGFRLAMPGELCFYGWRLVPLNRCWSPSGTVCLWLATSGDDRVHLAQPPLHRSHHLGEPSPTRLA